MEEKGTEDTDLLIQIVLATSDQELTKRNSSTKAYPICQQLISYIKRGWLSAKQLSSDNLREYWSCKHELAFDEHGIILKPAKVFVPFKMRPEILTNINSGHFSYAKYTNMARQYVFWLYMSRDIFDF